ncbi:Ig-like domain-containing protein [Rhodococcus sp. OK519]|uniref:beta strand repeat-containing protein n=1 Tax=Rhodococcus sp. OK519 TaxID=2135729 RepID=UPI0021593D16
MKRRRVATPLLAGIAAVGLAVGGLAPATAATFPTTNTATQDLMNYTKSVVGPSTVHPGDLVTYKTVINHTGGTPEKWTTWVRDTAPAGFVAQSATLTYTGVTNRATISGLGTNVVEAKCNGGCSALGGGFVVKSGQGLIFDVTYLVPATQPFGVYDSGINYCNYKVGGGCNQFGANPFGVKVEVADPIVATSTTLQVPATATTGQPVTFTATVNPSAANGQVQFKDGGTNIGSPVTPVNGVATHSHIFPTSGGHTITAEFVAGSGYSSSTSVPQTVTVSDQQTVTTVSTPVSALTGESVSLSASVSPVPAGGTVQFTVAGGLVGTPVNVDGSGNATMPYTFNAAGPFEVTAVYSGVAGFGGSTSSPQSVTVSDPDVVTSLTLDVPASAVTGSSVDLAATVTPSGAQGAVQFTDNGNPIGGPISVANGVATLSHTFGSSGAHSVGAEFVAGAGYTTSSATAQTVTVADPDVETSLSVTAPGAAETGESLTFSAQVTPSTAQGEVQFRVNGNPVGTPQAVSGGAASLPYTFSAAGSFEVTAEFAGAAGFTNATAAAQTVAVSVPDAVTSLTLNVPATAVTGTSVNLTAAVSPAGAQGLVQFTDGGNPIGSPVSVVNGVATLSHTFTAGSHSIGASFTGGPGFTDASASSPASIVVSDPDQQTTTTVTVPGMAQTGTAVTLEATVAPAPSGGTVQFKVGGVDVGAPVTVSSGTASLPWTFNAAGSFAVTAEFSGAAGFTDSSASAQSVVVSDPDQQTSLTVEVPGSATTGSPVNLVANLTPQSAQGEVQFTDNGNPIGSPVSVVNGVATLPHTFAAGSHSIGASFTGGTGFADASATTPGSIVVADPDQQTSLSVTAPATATTGESVSLSATVSPSSAQGTVQFMIGGVAVGSPQTVSGGVASLPHTFNAAGSFAVTAEFSGAAGFTNSTASAQTVTVTDPAPVDVATSTLVGVPGSATTGTQTTLSVTVQAQSGTAAPTGSAQFRENGSPIGLPVTLVNGSASIDHIFTSVGTRQVSAAYTADAGFVGSTSMDRPVVVSAPNPSDVVSSVVIASTQTPTVGTPYVLKAQVIGAATLPGTVQFFDGGIEIGSPVPVVDGFAELTHSFTQSGPRQIHAVYSGGIGVAGSTSETKTLDVVQSGGGAGGAGSLDFGSLGSLSGFRFGS